MGLRYRTPISTLHEQRRRAEKEAVSGRVTVSHLRVRALESLQNGRSDGKDGAKGRELLDRLRQALQGEINPTQDAEQEYNALQDELARVNMRQMHGQNPAATAEIEIQMDAYRSSTQPFTLVLINNEESKSFPKRISRLDAPLSNFASYLPEPEAPKGPPVLTLAPQAPAPLPKDHSDFAAQLVQDAMSESKSADTQISASLALSLLND